MSRTIWLSSFLGWQMFELTKSRKISPIGLDRWQKRTYTNCLGFAIGYSEHLEFWEVEILNMDPTLEIGEAFVKKLEELGYELPRRIKHISEADIDEYVLAIFGFVNYHQKMPVVDLMEIANYHVVRREPNGTWVHKPGWWQEPRVICSEDEANIRRVFNVNKVALFAFRTQPK